MATTTVTCTKDAFMGKQISGGTFSGWNGKDDHLPLGKSVSGTYKWRSLVYFPISFSGMTGITSATLKLYSATTGTVHAIQSGGSSTLQVRRMTDDWGEGTSIGEGNLTGTLSWEWDNRYDHYTEYGAVDKSINQIGDANGDEQTIDVTSIVTAWFNGQNNYGVILKVSAETTSSEAQQYFARENGNSSRVPKITIVYTTNIAPNAPTSLTPSSAIVNTMPTFVGTRSDPDSGDFITAAGIQVYGPAALFRWSANTSNANPGSGYINVYGNGYTASESDKNGSSTVAALSSVSVFSDVYIIARTDPSRFYHFTTLNTTADLGTWRTHVFDTKTAGALTADEDVYLIFDHISYLYWDSATVTISGSPASFSIPYGSNGTPLPIGGNACYIWRARTRDKASEWGPFSGLKTFKANTTPGAPTVTIVSTPTTDINSSTPSFTVTHVDADPDDQKMYYHTAIVEQYSGGAWSTYWDSGSVSHIGTPVTTASFDSTVLPFGGHYRIKCRTQDSSGTWSPFSASKEFYTHKATMTALAPSGSASTSATPTFTGSAGTSSDVITAYTISVYTADGITQMLAPTRYTTGIVGGGTGFSKLYAGSALTAGVSYVWYVFIETASGDTSDTSAAQSFYVADATVPAITAPIGSASYTITPTITGTRATVYNRFKYEIYPSTSTDAVLGTVIYASASLSATITGAGPTTFSAVYGGSPALVYGTTYRTRVAVSPDAGSTWSAWSGLVTWATDSAALGTPYSPAEGAWITSTAPSFYISRGSTDTIDQMQVRVWNATETTMIWDSGMTNVTNGTTNVGPIAYGGAALTGGITYKWEARYQNTTGAIGGYFTKTAFRVNGAPTTPTDLYPTPSLAFADTLYPTFRATFGDPDQSTNGDTAANWYIRILNNDGTTIHTTIAVPGTIASGANEYIWQSGDFGLTSNVDYTWQTWFTDSKGATGAYSSQSLFKMGVSPNGTITTPTNGSNVSTTKPQIDWSYTGGTQMKYRILVYNSAVDGKRDSLKYNSHYTNSAATTFTIPSGQLKDKLYYEIVLDVTSTDNLQDPSPSSVNIQVLQAAPDPITGLSLTTFPEKSLIKLGWDQPTSLKTGQSFGWYQIERRMVNDDLFTIIGTTKPITEKEFDDYYAGHDVEYQYRVTIHTSKTGSDDLESPDGDTNLANGKLASDVWMFVGHDRAKDHVQELFVNDEDHTRPVQQESFETLGSNRKVILRGFVLGNEGNISMTYSGNKLVASATDRQIFYEETVLGRRLIDYLTFHAGPHILKSPFGDVWDVEFASPQYKWVQGGNLQVDLSWVETGQTSQNGSI